MDSGPGAPSDLPSHHSSPGSFCFSLTGLLPDPLAHQLEPLHLLCSPPGTLLLKYPDDSSLPVGLYSRIHWWCFLDTLSQVAVLPVPSSCPSHTPIPLSLPYFSIALTTSYTLVDVFISCLCSQEYKYVAERTFICVTVVPPVPRTASGVYSRCLESMC